MTDSIATYSVPEHHVKMYTANVTAALYKQGALLMPYVSQAPYSGEKAQVVNFVGPVEFTERDTPYGDTKLSEIEHTQRWIVGREYDCAILIDRLDTLKMIYDPTSPYVEAMRAGAARKMDEIIMSRIRATAKTGKDGTTDTIYKTANTVVHGGTNLTTAKLRSLRKLIKKRHVDLRTVKPIIAVTSEQIEGSLMSETQTTSSDYAAVKALVEGEISQFMGFMFVPYESVGDGLLGKGIPSHSDTGTVRECPVWLPRGMHYGSWAGLSITINPRPDKNNIKQAHATFTAGATRVEEDNVFVVECNEG